MYRITFLSMKGNGKLISFENTNIIKKNERSDTDQQIKTLFSHWKTVSDWARKMCHVPTSRKKNKNQMIEEFKEKDEIKNISKHSPKKTLSDNVEIQDWLYQTA